MPSSQVGFPSDLIVDPPVVETKTGDYVAVNGDFTGRKFIQMDSASPIDFTINTGITNAGAILLVQEGAGQLAVVAGAGVTIKSPGGILTARDQFSVLSIIPVGSNTYYLSGDIG